MERIEQQDYRGGSPQAMALANIRYYAAVATCAGVSSDEVMQEAFRGAVGGEKMAVERAQSA